jgi:hypothetical protein
MPTVADLLVIAAITLGAGLIISGLLLARAGRNRRRPRDDFMFREDHWGM